MLAACSKGGDDGASATRIAELEARVAALESRMGAMPAETSGLDAAPFEELATRLNSEDALERLRAAQALSRSFAEMRVDAMKLLREGTLRQREALAVLLSSSATADMAPDLLAAHAVPANDVPRVRVWLDKAIARAGSPGATDALIADLAHGDETVRAAAVEALGRLGDPRAAAPLAKMAVTGTGPAAGLAAGALRALGEPAIGFIASSWGQQGPRDREAIIAALQPMQGEAVDVFLKERLEDPSALVALEAARVLGARGDMTGRDLAVERLKSEDPQISRAARAALDAMETAP